MMNRKLIALLLSVMMLMTAASALAMTPGTYTGVAKGMFDGLTVEVTVTEDAITDVKVTEYQETAPGWPALPRPTSPQLRRRPSSSPPITSR